MLKPDAYVRVGVYDYELTMFIEQDMNTESLPTIGRKLDVYLAYWRSGTEQQRHGVFPRVWWLVPDQKRLIAITDTIQRLPQNVHGLFSVALTHHAPDRLIQLPQPEGGAR